MSELGALQACLAAEHEALYAYGVVGGVLSAFHRPTDLAYATASYNAHLARRDTLTGLIVKLSAPPTPAAAVYAIPFPVNNPLQCSRLARTVERRTAAVYCTAVSSTTDATRDVLAAAVADAAVREYRWGGRLQAFPGAPEL
jgi:hypothetical protein